MKLIDRIKNIRNYFTDAFSLAFDIVLAAIVWHFFFREINVYLFCLGIPLGIRAVLLVWKVYTYFKKALWIANVEQKRDARLIAEKMKELDLPAPPFMVYFDVTDYFDAIANAEDAKPEHIYAAGFLTGSIKGLEPVSFMRYRLALLNYKNGMEEYRRQFVPQPDGEMIRKDKLKPEHFQGVSWPVPKRA